MRIAITEFGGIVPSLDEFNLPTNGAQIAKNVDLSGSTLRKMSLTNISRRLHDDNGRLVGDVTAAEFGDLIPKATKVTDAADRVKMCVPWWGSEIVGLNFIHYGWLDIRATFVYEYVDNDTGQVRTLLHPLARTCINLDYTSTGFILTFQLLSSGVILDANVDYTLRGPLYQVLIADTEGLHYTGRHDEDDISGDRFFPPAITGASSKVPDIAIPIHYPSSMDKFVPPTDVVDKDNYGEGFLSPTDTDESVFQYGTLTLDDVDGPHIDETFRPLTGGTLHDPFADFEQSGYASFTFNCNYVQNRPKRYYYIQQNVDSSEREGEQSDVSDEVSLMPGEVVRLNTPRPDSDIEGRKLFRSIQSAEGFGEIDYETEKDTVYYDNFRSPIIVRLKPNGTIPHDTVAEALFGSIRHPAGYVVYHFGSDIRPSAEWEDLERPWAVPLEYAHTFDSTVLGMALSGSTILVFTQNRVYRVFGQHPQRLTVALLSEKPILGVKTIWRESNTVGWLNEEGIVAYTGGEKLLTGEYHRAEQWNALTPSGYSAWSNDRNILLYNPARDDNLRFDFRGNRLGALSTFGVDDGTRDWVWKSKRFQLENAISWKACQITATGFPISLSLIVDGVKENEVGILDNNSFLLPRLPKAKGWEFQLRGRNELRDFAIATNIQELARAEI